MKISTIRPNFLLLSIIPPRIRRIRHFVGSSRSRFPRFTDQSYGSCIPWNNYQNQLVHDSNLIHTNISMANSKWTYVKSFELADILLPNCWIVARIDGRGFHKLAKKHNWKRPNDTRALHLMNHAAKMVMSEFNDIILGYGQSDEYSFLFRRETNIFERRSAKIITTLVSKFSSSYVYNWKNYFVNEELQYPPSFDGRIILYPTDQNMRDYLSWRQADCHINNLYNTTFWSLVQDGGLTNSEAEKKLSGTLSGDKNEILFSQFGINYNNEPELFRKGTVLVSPPPQPKQCGPRVRPGKDSSRNKKIDSDANQESPEISTKLLNLHIASVTDDYSDIIELNCDIIQDKFWNDYPYLLSKEKGL